MNRIPEELLYPILELATEEISYADISSGHGSLEQVETRERSVRSSRSLSTKLVSLISLNVCLES